ncbi:uncharacterized protein LOC113866558 [Abrus precatorius]|uniref:Uncharacterized protein LOC113866558 n=1 Tax=Abrus precatorius TaxID=3816 RepID=A0A8B8LLP6_ABRPR|nr:uncharacterized protein LOC113866558 [Abrus precatorius]
MVRIGEKSLLFYLKQVRNSITLIHSPVRSKGPYVAFWDLANNKGSLKVAYLLWKIAHERLFTNEEIFNRGMTNSFDCPRCGEDPETIMHVLRDSFFARQLQFDYSSHSRLVFDPGLARWSLPPTDQFKLNVYGAVSRTNEVTACGGLIRDSHGRFIMGFCNSLDPCFPLTTKLWGIFLGIQMVVQIRTL